MALALADSIATADRLAHDPKVEWDMTEQDALDILTMISLVHRKLDQAYRFRP